MAREKLSLASARRLALAAQGFADPRPQGRVGRPHLRRVLDRVGLIQIDSVNVLVRSQELPLHARLGGHPRALIPDATADGELFEYWGHEASHIPARHHRLFRWKMERAYSGLAWSHIHDIYKKTPQFVADTLARVKAEGPVAASALSTRTGPKGTWWDWDDAKRALEFLFWTGQITARRRASDFARLYDIPERMIAAEHLSASTPTEPEARKELLRMAARSLGVATAHDLADYHRQRETHIKHLLPELIEDGSLVPVSVEGWPQQAFMHPEAEAPRRVGACALLSPFDSLVWNRRRNERLFGFEYRIEIYTPEPQRRYGYYVLPFLLGDSLVARVDLKADRAASTLLVPGAFAEPGADPAAVAGPLADELRSMASWLDLEQIKIGRRGSLARPLSRALRRS